jgi:hypothetical protein
LKPIAWFMYSDRGIGNHIKCRRATKSCQASRGCRLYWIDRQPSFSKLYDQT